MEQGTAADVVTLGETMVLFVPDRDAPLEEVQSFSMTIGGTESNTAIGLARMGHHVRWISRVGDDPFGRFMTSKIGAEGVDISGVQVDPTAPTGIFFRERLPNSSPVGHYYRRGSAASLMTPSDLDPSIITNCRLLHLTGISPILSQSMRETTAAAKELAQRAGVPVSFDPNIRLRISTLAQAREAILPLIKEVALLLSGLSEMRLLLDVEEPQRIIKILAESYGVTHVVLKDGARGAWIMVDGQLQLAAPVNIGPEIDPTGAGDAFNAGYMSGWLHGMDPVWSARLGAILGGYVVTAEGDYESLPSWPIAERWLRTLEQGA